MWKHVALTDLRFNEPPPGVYPEPVVPGFPTLDDSYTIFFGGDQYLVQYSGEEKRGFGIFSRASISDGNPTPLRYFLSAGIGGYSPLAHQRGDTFGIGWYYVGASNEFGPIPQAVFGPRDGTGVECFYNVQVNPWLNVTPDIQFLKPEASAIADEAIVYGFRVNTKF
jgi:porin